MNSEQLEAERRAFEDAWEKAMRGNTLPLVEDRYFEVWLLARGIQYPDITGMGTWACPICGLGEPHQHSSEEMVQYRQAARSQPAAPKVVSDAQIDHAIMIHEGVRAIPKGGWGDKSRERMRAALESIAPAQPSVPVDDDKRRMDFLETMYVEVRIPARYGSRAAFVESPEDDEGDIIPSRLRSAVDKLIAHDGRENG